MPLEAVGLYALSDRVAMLFKVMVNQLNTAFQPHFMGTAMADRALAVRQAGQMARLALFLLGMSISALSLFSVELVYYLLDRGYFHAWLLIPLLASSYCFRLLYCFGSAGLFFEKRTELIASITGVAAAVNIAINLLFLPKHGVIVAVYSTMAAFAVSYLLAVILGRRIFPIQLDNRANIAILAYLYAAIGISAWINSDFTLIHPKLDGEMYAVKVGVLAAGVLLGWRLKFVKLDFLRGIPGKGQ